MTKYLNGAGGELTVAVIFWTWAHFMAHFGVAAGYLVATTRSTSALARLLHLSRATKLFGAGFFVFCAATHLGLALNSSSSPVITATDELQLVSIWGFLIGLVFDSRRVVIRLSNALDAIRQEYDGLAVLRGEPGRRAIENGEAEALVVGSRVVATIEFALFGEDDRPTGPEIIPLDEGT